MDRETAHKLLDLVLNAKHEGLHIEFAPPCAKGFEASIYIHDWQGEEIVSSRKFTMVRDGMWRTGDDGYRRTQEVVEALEGLQDVRERVWEAEDEIEEE